MQVSLFVKHGTEFVKTDWGIYINDIECMTFWSLNITQNLPSNKMNGE